jgi:hypothetical protein
MADTTPPTLNSLTLPGTVDLSGASPVVTIGVAASDDLSGVDSVVVFFDKALSVDINGSPTPLTGSYLTKQTDGSFSTSLTLVSFASAGTYHISDIQIQDNAGNFNDYQASTLASLNIATAFTLTGGTPDTTLPTLNSLTLPGTVDLSGASPVVTIGVAASDDLSGVNSVVVFLDKALSVDINGSPTDQQGWYLTKQPDGSFSTSLTLSSLANAGTYHISDIQIQDNAGNLHDYQASALASLNIATAFAVGVELAGVTINGTAGNDLIDLTHTVPGQPFPTAGDDIINGGGGSDTLTGGPGADTFVFDQTTLNPAQPGSSIVNHILDYDQGNSGTFNLTEGDTLDFSALLSAGSGQPVGNLVRVLENPSGTAAIVQIDQDGVGGAAHWTTIAQLDGVHAGDGVEVIFDASQPGATLASQSSNQIVFVQNSDNANIARLYSAALDRVADVAGQTGWENIYANNIPAAVKAQGVYAALAQTNDGFGTSIAGGFVQSAEFQHLYGALTETGYLTQLYLNVLDRTPATAEVNAWLGLMHDQGFTRDMVLVGFAESPENIAKASGWLIEM